jgi:hypothetical protein
MPICDGCGGSYDSTFKFCPNCGRASPQSNIMTNSVFASQSMLACPKCHKDDNVAKVSAILQRDTHVVQSQVPVTSVRTNDSGTISSDTNWHNVSSTQRSNLAQALLPPPPPVRNDFGYIWSIICAIGIGLGVLCCLPLTALAAIRDVTESIAESSSEMGQTLVSSIGLVVAILIASVILGWVAYYYVSRDAKYKKDYPLHRNLWESAMRRYGELYYCSRDDCIFIPGENTSAPISNLMEYINWHPYSSNPPFRVFQF